MRRPESRWEQEASKSLLLILEPVVTWGCTTWTSDPASLLRFKCRLLSPCSHPPILKHNESPKESRTFLSARLHQQHKPLTRWEWVFWSSLPLLRLELIVAQMKMFLQNEVSNYNTPIMGERFILGKIAKPPARGSSIIMPFFKV